MHISATISCSIKSTNNSLKCKWLQLLKFGIEKNLFRLCEETRLANSCILVIAATLLKYMLDLTDGFIKIRIDEFSEEKLFSYDKIKNRDSQTHG